MRIPNIVSEPIRDVLPNSGNPAMGTPDAFSAGVGEALARSGRETAASGLALGQSIVGAGVAAGNLAQDIDRKMDASATASGVANFDFTKDYIDLQKTPPKDGMTYQQSVANAYDAKLDKYLEGMPNDTVRNAVRDRLVIGKKSYIDAAAQYQDRQLVENDKLQADSGLTVQLNGVFVDPSIDNFNDRLAKGLDIIATRPNMTPQMKEAQTKGYTQMLAQRRFEGLINASKYDPEALAGIEAELTMPNSPWATRMSDEAFTKTLERIVTLKHAANSQESTAARGALADVKELNEKMELIAPEKLAAIQDVVMKSKNPALLSQFAMIQRQQSIYREYRTLPPDQIRAKIEEMRKQPGIAALPAPVQAGITSGSALTNGEVSTAYLAGLTNIEYGAHVQSGDYGRGTDVRGANGQPVTNVKGVAQFSEDTFLQVVKAHAKELGIDPNQSREAILALRANPEISLNAAALHAADNKRALTPVLGTPPNDGDLYFAHLLGLGGATRFLTAATQNPNGKATAAVDAESVKNNRAIFYDESGRERTNAQVRMYISDVAMNGKSRVDYSGETAAVKTLNHVMKSVHDDPITFARQNGNFGDVGDISTPEGLERRGIVAGQMAEFYKVPASKFKPLTKSEVETMTTKAKDGTAEETLQVMMQIQGLKRPDLIKAANNQIGEKDSLFGHAAGLAYALPSQISVASDIVRGEKRLKADKDLSTTLGATEPDRITLFNSVVGKSVYGFNVDDASATSLRKAADALYAERFLARGNAKQGALDTTGYTSAINLVLGGGANPEGKAIDSVNGKKMVLPSGISAPEFQTALNRMGDNDYTASSVFGGPPRYKDGAVVKASDIAQQGTFVSLGGDQYIIRMSDGKELIGQTFKDGSTSRYVFRANPQILRDIASRTNPNMPTPPAIPALP